MSWRCALADTPNTPLFVFKRVSMTRVNMLTLDCDWDNCDFQTPLLNREHYQAMVAHLQVIKHRKNCECCPGHYLSTSVY